MSSEFRRAEQAWTSYIILKYAHLFLLFHRQSQSTIVQPIVSKRENGDPYACCILCTYVQYKLPNKFIEASGCTAQIVHFKITIQF